MIWFVLAFMTVYTGFHILFYRGVRAALPRGPWWRISLIAWMGLMQLTPLIYRFFEHQGLLSLASATALLGYFWMGLVILALIVLGIIHLSSLALKLIRRKKRVAAPVNLARRRAVATLVAAPVLAGYGVWESRQVQTRRLIIATPKLPPNLGLLKIALISDLHLSVMTDIPWLDSVLGRISKEAPDIVISAGDFLDGRMPGMTALSARLNEIPAPLGKYAVIGNHEYYVGLDHALDCHQSAGFKLLRGEGLSVEGCVNLAGSDDARQPAGPAEAAMLSKLPQDLFTIFVRHRPLVPDETLGLFDLQLSGHTHGGQITPFGMLVRLQFPYLAGGYQLEKGSRIYVNRGTGTWGPPMRVASPPEVTIIELVAEPVKGEASNSMTTFKT